jgi:hypothetical protein
MLRDGVVTIHIRRLGDAGVALARRPAVATYRIGLADSYGTAPRGTRKAVRRTA